MAWPVPKYGTIFLFTLDRLIQYCCFLPSVYHILPSSHPCYPSPRRLAAALILVRGTNERYKTVYITSHNSRESRPLSWKQRTDENLAKRMPSGMVKLPARECMVESIAGRLRRTTQNCAPPLSRLFLLGARTAVAYCTKNHNRAPLVSLRHDETDTLRGTSIDCLRRPVRRSSPATRRGQLVPDW